MDSSRFFLIGGGELVDEERDIYQELFTIGGSNATRVCFVPTASQDSPSYAAKFRAFAKSFHVETLVLDLGKSNDEATALLKSSDIVYVGGGTTSELVRIWLQRGWDRLFLNAAREGVVLSGISAGAMCWFEHSLVKESGVYKVIEGLGFLKGTLITHFDQDDFQSETANRLASGELTRALALSDSSAVFIKGKAEISKFGKGEVLLLDGGNSRLLQTNGSTSSMKWT